jgi:hypothetical protein
MGLMLRNQMHRPTLSDNALTAALRRKRCARSQGYFELEQSARCATTAAPAQANPHRSVCKPAANPPRLVWVNTSTARASRLLPVTGHSGKEEKEAYRADQTGISRDTSQYFRVRISPSGAATIA